MFSELRGKPAVVLIVDDQPSNIKILREAIRDFGEVYFATSGKAALELAQRCLPDVVLLDIEMQDMDGYAVCAKLKADPALKDAAVIFVTSHTGVEFELQALAHGAVDFLHKPLNVPVARARIRSHVQLHVEARKLLEASRDLEDLLEHLPAFIAYWSAELTNLFCNDRHGSWFGVAAQQMQGQPMAAILGERNTQVITQDLEALQQGAPLNFEIELATRHGENRYAQVTLIARRNGSERPDILMLLTDVSARKLAEHAKLDFLHRHDALTHLPNQLFLREHTQGLLDKHNGQGLVGMLVLDIDHFKTINDTLGHATGDRLLQLMAVRLKHLCRNSDTLSRPGGDEFVILVGEAQNSAALSSFAERVLHAMSEPFWLENQRHDLHVSIGISVFPHDSADVQLLFRHAETAMYQAKQEGRHRWRFFSVDTENDLRARHQLERQLREAIHLETFEVHYQAKVDCRLNQTVGVEALIRWPNPQGDPVPPARFIPLAEETGLILPIGQFVLQRACEDGRKWQDLGLNICVSVNISYVQFREATFLQMVTEVLESTGLQHHLLELEITEGVLVTDFGHALETLTHLHQLGVRIAIDDFGTGYSNLAYLKRFPINVLKIDQSFVRDMLEERTDLAIVEAIIHIAQALELELVAEGVETSAQADLLVAKGCAVIQGYLYSRPVIAARMTEFLTHALPLSP
ncbi:putative bifunctional diguanylate cyclase/phosphodiesterase [Pseudomonas turukhanskensis]|uniref:GGDEF domain-containing response regulator n=1 Tax=Pseudomonas turukhanskensis TaxID=1806536 RepID=A0A9W6K7R3_9PSED|nr:EAL domain-containing protein [Pseudomonas turukhanskensis]GLK88493.1 GGDEF domain-containing response regulator [Pseudomonas turukhanskensis]